MKLLIGIFLLNIGIAATCNPSDTITALVFGVTLGAGLLIEHAGQPKPYRNPRN